ncbi:MAG: GNAT family N-acetyltransferase [Salinivirgaceae bacterium]
MEYKITSYQPSDYKALEALWISTGLGNAARGDNQQTIAETLALEGVLYVMKTEPGNELIGTSWITNDGRRLYLHHFGIKPEYQNQGLSKPLLKKSLEFAKQMNRQIKLEVHRDNLPALTLYEKSGFTYLGDYLVYIIRKPGEIIL